MWIIIGLQVLTGGVALVSLFLKQSADFDITTSITLGLVAVLSSAMSVKVFADQDKDVKFIKRNLENIVRSSQPNSFTRDNITKYILRCSKNFGLWKTNVTIHRNGLSAFSFYVDDEKKLEGLLLITQDEFNRFAIFSEDEVSREIIKYMEESLEPESSEDWNTILNEFGRAGQYVAAKLKADPSISNRIWADPDKRLVGLFTARHLRQPDLILEADELAKVQALPRIQRHLSLARLIEKGLTPAKVP